MADAGLSGDAARADAATADAATADAGASPWRRRLLLWAVPLAAGAVALYLYGNAGRYVETDNAYVQRDRIDVVPQVAGEVREVRVQENERVAAGQPVLVLDDTVFRIAVEGAGSRLASARADIAATQASYREKSGEVAVARATAQYALREYRRQGELAARQLVSQSDLDTAHRSADLAQGAIAVLDLQRSQLLAKLSGDPDRPVDAYPAVRAVAAELERARVDLARTRIAAPQAGVVSHLPKVGSHVDVGHAAFAIVSDSSPWVEANFKETDLQWVRSGEPVRIVVDTYPGRVWHGRVASIAQATGAEFSLLPPQNASGNWVKVVQRIPVRVALALEPGDPPLRDGMSATVEIDTGPHTRFDHWLGRDR
jgi:membrane fusion protein (multidrug efflux system)